MMITQALSRSAAPHQTASGHGNAVRQRRPLDQLHDQGLDPVGLFEPVHVRDVRVIQRREDLRLPLNARQPLPVLCKRRNTFNASSRLSARCRARHTVPHPALAQERGDFIGTDARAGRRRHVWSARIIPGGVG
jgi:hypothetical protein